MKITDSALNSLLSLPHAQDRRCVFAARHYGQDGTGGKRMAAFLLILMVGALLAYIHTSRELSKLTPFE